MSGKSPILIHLFLEDRALAERWHAALADCADISCLDPRTSFVDSCRRRNGPPHLVAIDREMSLEQRAKRALKRGEIALLHVRLGAEHGEAHDDGIGAAVYAELPPDAAAREIVLVCRLLGEIVRLRRRAHRKARQQRHLAALVDTDPLTGLLNRRGWQGALDALVRHSAGAQHCLLIIDIDHFKRVNDSSGYAVGDAVLSEVGSALRQAVRTGDAVARLGGDEFGVLLANVEPQVAGAIVERLRSRISVSVGASKESLSASAGYVCFTAGKGFDEQAIMVAADSALREAKLAGRDQAVAATLAN